MSERKTATCFTAKIVIAIAVSGLLAKLAPAATCHVVIQQQSEGDKSFLAGDYEKAIELYQSRLAANRADLNSVSGLVHSLLRQQKVQEAMDALKQPLAADPNSPALLTLRGEVEYRQGVPWTAAETANLSVRLDPCNPRTHLLLYKIAAMSFLYATAVKQIAAAHQLDPEDPDIRLAWISTLPLKQRTSELEAFLATPTGFDQEDRDSLWRQLHALKRMASEPHSPCQLVSKSASTEIPFSNIMASPKQILAYGLDLKLNGQTARLEIDTGAGGLLISRRIAKRAGLKPFSPIKIGGIGDKGQQEGYSAIVDSIRIGDLEFKHCPVQVMDSRGLDVVEGIIGMNILSKFLVTLDYPNKKLVLGPLVPRPDEPASVTPNLNMSADQFKDELSVGASEGASQQDTSQQVQRLPQDRFVAPEMKDYTKVFRRGPHLLIPARLNGQTTRLFLLDTGAWTTSISPEAAREVSKVSRDNITHVFGANGEVKKIYSANDVTFQFANVSQQVQGVLSFDMSKLSKDEEVEVSGLLGATTLYYMTIHIDYRDGLVKFDYAPKSDHK